LISRISRNSRIFHVIATVLLPISRPPQRSQLHQWLFVEEHTLAEVRILISKPEPEGFNLQTSIAAIDRYYQSNALLHQLTQHTELLTIMQTRPETLPETLDQFSRYALFNPRFNTKTFNSLIRLYRAQLDSQHRQKSESQRDRHLDLIDKRIHLETYKVQINVARKAIEHAAELQDIAYRSEIDNEEKIHQGREVVYGPNCIPTITSAPATPPCSTWNNSPSRQT
jgi:hypothetical protein